MQKPRLSFWQMFNLNFGFLGIQFGWALQMANMSGIYKFLGADASHMGYLWIAAPLSGMIIQPILGRISDRTWTFLGRRRPFILAGAILSSVVLLLMPNSPSLWVAAILLWLLDGSLNIAMQPYRALVADVAPEKQQTVCYCVQTALVGIGSTLASTLPWIFLHLFGLSDAQTATSGIPLTLKLSFYVGAAVFLLANLWTTISSKEYPPEEGELEKRGSTDKTTKGSSIIKDIIAMPRVMREVSVVQFFSWTGMFCVYLYFGLGVAQNIFGLPAGVDVTNNPQYRSMLEQGIAFGGLCFGVYTFASVFYAFLIPYIAKLITRKLTHALLLAIGAVGLIAANHITNQNYLLLCMIFFGATWASIITLPFAMLAGTLPKDRMGFYMGLLNLTICIPEIIAALGLGVIVALFFHERAMPVIQLGGISFALAAIATFFVHDVEHKEDAEQIKCACKQP
jgi:maltose/moltooligosaccharide transporter